MSAGTFPYSDIPLDATPGDDWATCGACGRAFPDIYPSARCPFEADHLSETETDTMTSPNPDAHPVVGVDISPEGAALLRAFESIGAILGGSLEWEVETIEYVADEINRACRVFGLPQVSDQDESAHRFWAAVGDRLHIEHDDLAEVYGDDEIDALDDEPEA